MSSILESSVLNDRYDLEAMTAETSVINAELSRLHLFGKEVTGKIFAGSQLSNLTAIDGKFVTCRFLQSKFEHSDLRQTVFSGCFFKEVEFSFVALKNVSFVDCTFEDCRFAFQTEPDMDDEVAMTRCVFIDPHDHLGGLIAMHNIQVTDSLFQERAVPKHWEKGNNMELKPKPKAKPVTQREVKQPAMPAPAPMAPPASAPAPMPKPAENTAPTRFDKLEI